MNTLSISEDVTTNINIFNNLIAYNCHQSGLIIYLSYNFFSAVRHPPSAVPPFTESCIFVGNGTQCNSTLFILAENVNGFAKKVTNLIVFMVNTNVDCQNCILIRNIRCQVSTSIYGWIGTPF